MYGLYERGQNSPSLLRFRDLCVVLNADADGLLGLGEIPEPTTTRKRAVLRRRAQRAIDGAKDEDLRLILHVLANCGRVSP